MVVSAKHTRSAGKSTARQKRSQQAPPQAVNKQAVAPTDAPITAGDLTITPQNILTLQRTIGNRAVSQLLKQQQISKQTGPIPISRATAEAVQRAIGLEIEVAVPVDEMTALERNQIRDAAGHDGTQRNMPPQLQTLDRPYNRKVEYTRGNGPKATNGHFRAEVDHDSRVKSGKHPPFPFRDLNNTALLEIVMEPKANKTEFDTAMDSVADFVQDVDNRTANLTTHSLNPYGTGHNLGPMSYPDIGAMPKEPNHNWKGSIQVNIGVDMREYASMAKWYAKSTYADPKKEDKASRKGYTDAKKNILKAVDVGRDVTTSLMKEVSKEQRGQMGNMRGIRGWITHMALYMIGGKAGIPSGSTIKNITPILMKSPNEIAIHYSMTGKEEEFYLLKREDILKTLIAKTGRDDIDATDPLAGGLVKGGATSEAYQQAREKLQNGVLFNDLDKEEQDAYNAYSPNLGDLSEKKDDTLLAGSAVPGEQPVGPDREVGTPFIGDEPKRGGAVMEYRNLPGYYEGPAAWRQVGYDFLREAETRNKRSGAKSDKLSKLKGDEWG